MGKDQPVLGLVEVVIRLDPGLVQGRLVIDRGDARLLWKIPPALGLQRPQCRVDRTAAVERVIDDQQPVLGLERVHEIALAVHADLPRLRPDIGVGGGPDRDVIGLDTAEFEIFLDGDSMGAPPRQTPTIWVGRKSLSWILRARRKLSASNSSAEMKVLETAMTQTGAIARPAQVARPAEPSRNELARPAGPV